jgi:urease accessory protein
MAIRTGTDMARTTMITDGALYRLATWLSPAYPVGAYSYSHGIEAAVDAGLVRDRESLTRWIAGILARGCGRVDAAFFAAAWRAAEADDPERLEVIVELARAWRGTAELALESRGQGAAFLSITRRAWPSPRLERLAGHHDDLPHVVAVAIAAACHGVALRPALSVYLASFAQNLVSAGVRLVPLGQSDGQLANAALEVAVAEAVDAGLAADLDGLGTAAPMVDWTSMRHERQYSRLFRS